MILLMAERVQIPFGMSYNVKEQIEENVAMGRLFIDDPSLLVDQICEINIFDVVVATDVWKHDETTNSYEALFYTTTQVIDLGFTGKVKVYGQLVDCTRIPKVWIERFRDFDPKLMPSEQIVKYSNPTLNGAKFNIIRSMHRLTALACLNHPDKVHKTLMEQYIVHPEWKQDERVLYKSYYYLKPSGIRRYFASLTSGVQGNNLVSKDGRITLEKGPYLD